MSFIVALDLGTTGNRAVAFDKKGAVAAKAYREFPQIFPRAGWVEHDPKKILETTELVLKEVAEKVGVSKIEAIGITNQRETTIIWDKQTGEPIFNAVVWQCRRTADICEDLKPHASLFKQKTGLFLDAYFSGTKIQWILDHVEGARQKAESGQLLFGTVDTWILWHLTKGKVHATEVSNASRTLCFNIHTLDYDQELLDLLKVPRQILPEVKESAGDFGRVDAQILGKEIPITGILGDQQASLLAQGGWQKGMVKNTYGTGLFVMTSSGGQAAETQRLVSTVAWKINGEITYALEGSIFVGGSCVQWVRDELQFLKSADQAEKMALQLKGNDDVYLVPAFVGLGAPYWDPKARGLLIGLTRGTTQAHIVRAALESMAYQTMDVIGEMAECDSVDPFNKLRVDGGAVNNNFLMQFQADILDMEVERPVQTETTVLGAAFIAGLAVGFWQKEDLQSIRGVEKTFLPDMEDLKRQELYDKWKKAVNKSLAWV